MAQPVSDLQRLVADFELLQSELRSLDEADKKELEYVSQAYSTYIAVKETADKVIAGNQRAKRERQVKVSNLQELIRPLLFPEMHLEGCQNSVSIGDCDSCRR